VERVNVASEKKMSGFMFGMLLSYMMVLLMFTGAMYPAIDMTAGEKERRTMEALLCSPASRLDLVMGKVLAAATAAFLTAILTLASMAYSIRFIPQPKDSPMAFKVAPDAHMFALVLLVMLPTAVMGAALMVGIALFAKSYKEGQSYLMPVILIVSFSAVAGMLPGAELSAKVALVPIFNSCQVVKQIFLGEMSAGMFALVVAINIVYAAIAFIVAARFFKSEKVLFRV
jgi:sodium transport system permease protein